ncbi:Smr/MutS family protein [Sphingomonas sp.]|uniref:Smr/MutS family protein n=1 Tax=Sphingomonas sp. TaxID=28214 RepID=UPI0025FF5AED|nr:Smr/MutS family protein [Sphingomonas sp.]
MAGRRLSADERALWSRVAASVRRARSKKPTEPLPETLIEAVPATKAKPPVAALARQPKAPPVQLGVTLDGSWDRRIATGGAAPERTVDLHGCGVDQAHRRLLLELELAISDDVRVLLVVTGKAPKSDASRIDLPLRGIIRASILDWLAASRHASRIAAIRPAHPRHGGAGALYIILRRAKNGDGARGY